MWRSTVADHDDDLRSIVDSLDPILGVLGDRGDELARAAENLGIASEGTADIIRGNRPDLDKVIGQLAAILEVVADHRSRARCGASHASVDGRSPQPCDYLRRVGQPQRRSASTASAARGSHPTPHRSRRTQRSAVEDIFARPPRP